MMSRSVTRIDGLSRPISVLVVDDDEEDFLITKAVLNSIDAGRFHTSWRSSYDAGRKAIETGKFDICFLDYHLGPRDGLELLATARNEDWSIPIVLLTGQESDGLDSTAVSTGAADYLQKQELSARIVERTVRYALERKKAEDDRRKMKDRLEEALRLESLGTLAGGVAHEINNILNIVMADAKLISQGLEETQEELQESVDSVYQAASRGAALTKKLLGYSRRERLDFRIVDLGAVITQTVQAARSMMGDGVSVTVEQCPDQIKVQADTGALKQILVNLLTNSRDAMTSGGTIDVRLSEYVMNRNAGEQRPWCVSGRYAHLTVVDRGAGIPDDVLRRVFEPFFTTKPPGEGTGLGLAMVYGLVKQHQGYIDIKSDPGKGTTVDIFFPLVTDAGISPSHRFQREALQSAQGNETVLFVEDQMALRRAGTRLLASLGYQVIGASNGAEGLSILEERDGEVDLVITDVVMPELNGPDFYDAVRTRGWSPRFLFMSGFSSTDVRKGALLDANLPLLQKPWTLEELAAHARMVLDQGKALITT